MSDTPAQRRVRLLPRIAGGPEHEGYVVAESGEHATVLWDDGAMSGVRLQFLTDA